MQHKPTFVLMVLLTPPSVWVTPHSAAVQSKNHFNNKRYERSVSKETVMHKGVAYMTSNAVWSKNYLGSHRAANVAE